MKKLSEDTNVQEGFSLGRQLMSGLVQQTTGSPAGMSHWVTSTGTTTPAGAEFVGSVGNFSGTGNSLVIRNRVDTTSDLLDSSSLSGLRALPGGDSLERRLNEALATAGSGCKSLHHTVKRAKAVTRASLAIKKALETGYVDRSGWQSEELKTDQNKDGRTGFDKWWASVPASAYEKPIYVCRRSWEAGGRQPADFYGWLRKNDPYLNSGELRDMAECAFLGKSIN